MSSIIKMPVRYKGTCPWMEDHETVAHLKSIRGRSLIVLELPNDIFWKYWHRHEFEADWEVIEKCIDGKLVSKETIYS